MDIRKSERSINALAFLLEESLCEALEMTRQLPGIYLELGVYKAGGGLHSATKLRSGRPGGGQNLVSAGTHLKIWLLKGLKEPNYVGVSSLRMPRLRFKRKLRVESRPSSLETTYVSSIDHPLLVGLFWNRI